MPPNHLFLCLLTKQLSEECILQILMDLQPLPSLACHCVHVCSHMRTHPGHFACLHSCGILFHFLLSPVFDMCLSAELISVCFPSCKLPAQISQTLKSNTCLIKRSCQTVPRVPDAITGIILHLLAFLLPSLRHPTATKNKISTGKPMKEKKKMQREKQHCQVVSPIK